MSTENRGKKEQGQEQEQETYGINFETLTEEAKKAISNGETIIIPEYKLTKDDKKWAEDNSVNITIFGRIAILIVN
jgi:hypothetical protein